VHDLLKSLWSSEVRGVNYTEAASDKKILEEDTKTAKEEYERAVSELWFALKKWAEFNFISLGVDAQSEELSKELSGRRYSASKLTRVETKTEYKSRGNPSPNKADALTLLLHGVRKASGCIPSALDDMAGVSSASNNREAAVPCVVDNTNRYEDIDDNEVLWLA
jgi:hypothetical protein